MLHFFGIVPRSSGRTTFVDEFAAQRPQLTLYGDPLFIAAHLFVRRKTFLGTDYSGRFFGVHVPSYADDASLCSETQKLMSGSLPRSRSGLGSNLRGPLLASHGGDAIFGGGGGGEAPLRVDNRDVVGETD